MTTRLPIRCIPVAIVVALMMFESAPRANNIFVPSCSSSDIQTAINSAASGDTVTVPAGTCTWTTPVSITAKRLTLVGAGIGVTNITLGSTDANNPPFSIRASATNFVRVTGFTFISGATAGWSNNRSWTAVDGTQGDVAFRIDHCRFYDNNILNGGARLISVTDVYGLFDHDQFDRDVTATNSVQTIDLYGTPDGSDGGYAAWAHPLSLGSNQAVYFEDDRFTNAALPSESIIENYTHRSVLRFSTIVNGHTGSHGVDSGNRRGPQQQEEYGNAFSHTAGGTGDAGTVRGGTGLYFGNTHSGSWNGIQIVYYRATASMSGYNFTNWGYCDGTRYDIGSADTSSSGSRKTTTYGTVARFLTNPDTICSGAATGSCTRAFDGAGVDGYPCRDQPGVGPGQILAPLYQWNNGTTNWFWNDVDCGSPNCIAGKNLKHWVAVDRDAFSGASGIQTAPTTPFNGTTGVGWGTLANRPSCSGGCTLNVGYFATDQGSWNTSTSNPYGVQQNGADGVLYQWNGSSWVTYYTPYQYPHALTGVPAPTNVRVVTGP